LAIGKSGGKDSRKEPGSVISLSGERGLVEVRVGGMNGDEI
jgi:hypothetical protein